MATAIIFLLLGVKATSEYDLNNIGLEESEHPLQQKTYLADV